MNNNKLNILFVLDKVNTNSKGIAPLRCRVTYLQERKVFSIGLFINPNNWDSKKQLAKPPNEENNFINTQLSLIKNDINQAFLFLQVKEEKFDVNDIYTQYKGETLAREYGVLEYYDIYLEKLKKLIDIEIKKQTWDKFSYIRDDVKEFIKFHYKKSDIKLKDLDFNFITEFEYYSKTELKHQQVTINKSLQRFKKVVKQAVIQKYLESNPFEEHKPKKVYPKIVFLTQEELYKLEHHIFQSEILNQVKDCYLFCCYTGLAYKEMFDLKKEDLITKPDGVTWIYKKRDKTGRNFSVPLILPKALKVIEKYSSESEYLLPRVSNQYFNRLLKEIAFVLKIPKNLTHHTGRKTFASTVLLNNDIPIEVISKLLGHSKITTTQEYYAELMPNKLSEQLNKLKDKLK
ncbi:site-specific integrase [Riemerella anatipestifer]|uniref:Integrase family protein n=1 Tax=Riemerella anatipestifer (strain ATCC 11845 / DSM 15868 / JCM 9532 / NCTC 11014) TaxID=693978 RepID=E4TAP5_RIEAD|nr:site-specific integrase [Riemerella anatipestifer]AKQ39867.1 integrase [Riemerella anatipestifer Yb2]ADQ82405.1 integrase family protein [Riemerella anatipestifer ATCC 11845 = DSM 15868]ADZ12100.1 integrase [Riemerella anatipestifer RA-GD]AFD56409.1 integrase family protein [Riemerella anatipestifer ATCC 11845 = DSM 15868]EFT36807.1 phage integrase family protein [Riemerella anatipestifer RA-YM]